MYCISLNSFLSFICFLPWIVSPFYEETIQVSLMKIQKPFNSFPIFWPTKNLFRGNTVCMEGCVLCKYQTNLCKSEYVVYKYFCVYPNFKGGKYSVMLDKLSWEIEQLVYWNHWSDIFKKILQEISAVMMNYLAWIYVWLRYEPTLKALLVAFKRNMLT